MSGIHFNRLWSAIRKQAGRLVCLFSLLALTLAACQSATLTPFEVPAEVIDTPVPATAEPTAGAEKTAGAEEPAVIPSVSVSDQSIETGAVMIAEVVSSGPGWLVVHAQAEDKPGPILGYSRVDAGLNRDVVVEIDPAQAAETLYAMLHADAGEVGKWEFPDGPDVPVVVDEMMVAPPFKILAATVAATPTLEEVGQEMAVEEQGEPVVLLGGNDELGDFLVGEDGMALYTFTQDEAGKPDCTDACAQEWPPLLIDRDQPLAAGEGVPGELGTVEREDGGLQVTYNGFPLYYWAKDQDAGGADGHGAYRSWAVARAETPVLLLGGNTTIGRFLTSADGMTLYIFAKDQPGVSNCYDQCAANWPPLLLSEGQVLYAGAGVIGELSTIERSDGGIQIAYNGMPLYYWIGDNAPGDRNGDGIDGVWKIADQWASLTSFEDGSSDDSGDDDGGYDY